MSFCRACFRMFPYICKEQMTSVTTILDYTTNKNFTKMKKKWICTVCGYVHEGDEAPEFCPQCKQPKSKFKEMVETTGALTFADEHVIGVAKGCDEEMIKDLNAHFMGECTEVGMYLAMSRQADRKAILKLRKHSNAMLGKKLNTPLSSPNCWAMLFGTQKQTWKNVKMPNVVLAKIRNVLPLVQNN